MAAKKKPAQRCKTCGAAILPVVYGEPPPEIGEAAERGELIIAGCILVGDPENEKDNPSAGCPNCFKRERILAIERRQTEARADELSQALLRFLEKKDYARAVAKRDSLRGRAITLAASFELYAEKLRLGVDDDEREHLGKLIAAAELAAANAHARERNASNERELVFDVVRQGIDRARQGVRTASVEVAREILRPILDHKSAQLLSVELVQRAISAKQNRSALREIADTLRVVYTDIKQLLQRSRVARP